MSCFIPLKGKYGAGKFAEVSSEDYEFLLQWKWIGHSDGYVHRSEYNPSPEGPRRRTIYMHHAVLGKIAGFVVDHINHQKMDNRKENLRFVTHAANIRHQDPDKHPGVYWAKEDKRWRASVRVGAKRIHLGAHLTFEAAAAAVREFKKTCVDGYFTE